MHGAFNGSRVPGMAGAGGIPGTPVMLLPLLSSCPCSAGDLECLSRPLERISWETGVARWVLASQGEPGPSCLAGHVGSHLSPLLVEQDISWGGAQQTAGERCPLGTSVRAETQGHQFTPELSALLPSLPLFIPLFFISSSTPGCPLPFLLSRSAGDTRAPGEPQQPGWGPGLRVPGRPRQLDGAAGFPPFLHRILRGTWKRLEVPLQGLHQWRRYSGILWSGHICPSLSWAGGTYL